MSQVREFHCNKSADLFCYVCGLYTPISQRRKINEPIKNMYKQYFNIDIANQDKCWVPHTICMTCRLGLLGWFEGKTVSGGHEKLHLTFGRPMLWRDPIDHQRNCYICSTILMGLQGGNTSFPCFLCLYNSRAYSSHFAKTEWPERKDFVIGRNNVVQEKIVKKKDNIIAPPLHIKLGIMTQFVKAVKREGNENAIDYLDSMFPNLSRWKVEEGVFVGPQIRKVLHSDDFKQHLTHNQKAAWESFEAVIDGFLGNHRSDNYRELVAKMLVDFERIGSHLPLKMHFLKSHLDYFPDNLGAFSDEQGERFHQDLADMEDRFNNRYLPNMFGEYCWSVLRDTRALHKRVGTKRHF